MEKAGKAFTDTGKVGKKFNPDHPEGTAGTLQTRAPLEYPNFAFSVVHLRIHDAGQEAEKQGGCLNT